jgi:hypothetical protein
MPSTPRTRRPQRPWRTGTTGSSDTSSELFGATDKDSSDWRADAAAFVAACRQFDVPTLAEISRSGAGAHVWVFFATAVAAACARAMGLGLLRKAMDHRAGMSLAGYVQVICGSRPRRCSPT